MSEPTHYDPWNHSGRVATSCEVSDKPTHSKILAPDGKPLEYERQPVGFDLKPKGNPKW